MSFHEFIETYKVRLGKPDQKDLSNFNEANLEQYSTKLQNLYYQFSVLKILGETLDRKSDLCYIHKPQKQQMNEDIDRFQFLKKILIEESVACISLRPEQLQQIQNEGFDRIVDIHGNQMITVTGDKNIVFRLKLKEFINCDKNLQKINEILVKSNQIPIVDEYDTLSSIIDDLSEWSLEKNRMSELLPDLSYCSQYNMLSYLREQMSPQVLIKFSGAKGYQKQNIGTTVINFNYGPSDCIWITIDKEQKNMIENDWIDLHSCLKKSITIKVTVQKAGDILILNPSALHFTKAMGKIMQFQWNFFLKDLRSFEQFYEFNLYNKQIPLTTFFMDIYNHEKFDLEEQTQVYLRSKLNFLFTQENEKLSQLVESLNAKTPEYRPDQLNVHRCSNCKGEIFNFFIFQQSSYYCIDCCQSVSQDQALEIFAKYKSNDLSELIHINKSQTCIPTLCFQVYSGGVNYDQKCSRRNQILKQKKKPIDQVKQLQAKDEQKEQQQEKKNDQKNIRSIVSKTVVEQEEKLLNPLELQRYEALQEFFDRRCKQDQLEDIIPKPQTSTKIIFHVIPAPSSSVVPPHKTPKVQIKKIQEILKRQTPPAQINEEQLMTTRKRAKILRKTGTTKMKNLYPRSVYDYTFKEQKKPTMLSLDDQPYPLEQIPIMKKQKKIEFVEPPKVDEWQ